MQQNELLLMHACMHAYQQWSTVCNRFLECRSTTVAFGMHVVGLPIISDTGKSVAADFYYSWASTLCDAVAAWNIFAVAFLNLRIRTLYSIHFWEWMRINDTEGYFTNDRSCNVCRRMVLYSLERRWTKWVRNSMQLRWHGPNRIKKSVSNSIKSGIF